MDGHGHGDGHDHGAATAHDQGPAELPPVPATRWISPARAEYEQPWPGGGLLWPVVWLAVAVVFYAAAGRWVGPVVQAHEGAEHPEHPAATPGGHGD